MAAQHPVLCLAITAVLALMALPAAAQPASTPVWTGPLKQYGWGRSALGLAVNRTDFGVPCPSFSTSCEEVSVVGRATVGDSPFSLFGKVGSTSHVKTYALGADSGAGLSYGAGVSWDFSPRASATVAWDTYDLRGAGAGAVRATSLGLQWRY
jgi:hypothetical protein